MLTATQYQLISAYIVRNPSFAAATTASRRTALFYAADGSVGANNNNSSNQGWHGGGHDTDNTNGFNNNNNMGHDSPPPFTTTSADSVLSNYNGHGTISLSDIQEKVNERDFLLSISTTYSDSLSYQHTDFMNHVTSTQYA